MTWIEAIVYGIVQGLTEFLPISSSGHLYLIPSMLGWKDAGAGFTAVIQLGTLLAVFIYFWGDLTRAVGVWFRSLWQPQLRQTPDGQLAWGVFWGTLPIIGAGLLLKDFIEGGARSPYVIGGTLIFFGLLMGAAESLGGKSRRMDDIRIRDGILMGIWQCLALVPGSSRSGCTMTGGMVAGLDRSTAARVSFLLSVPSVLASGLYKLYDSRKELLDEGAMPTIIATVVSFVVGYAAIAWLMKLIQNRTLLGFVWYRVGLGVLVIGLALAGVLKA